MRVLGGKIRENAEFYLRKASESALNSTCLQAKCGAVIVSHNEIIGSGFNSPPGNLESQRKCNSNKGFHIRITDRTCCMHAEQRAIMDALRKHPSKINGATIYFSRVDNQGKIMKAGAPYCTICSKLSLDVGLANFVLWHEAGITSYDSEEYNEISYNYI